MTAKAKLEKVDASQMDAAKSRREAVESIVVAIVLAFLFRAFEAEAFVIPTGSMAPTLQGRHKDIDCPECGYQYQAGASEDSEYQRGDVEATTCPMCYFEAEIERSDANHFSHTGDRILVNKFAYEPPFGDPQRWDVIVFKYPGNAKQNYIKRLVGLANETVQIRHGDIFVRPAGAPASEVQIARKPADKLRHMLQLVHDTQHLASTLRQVDWPSNWAPYGTPSGWSSDDQGVTHHCPPTDQTSWLHYRHYFMNFELWDAIREENKAGRSLSQEAPMEIPITDFYAYNAQTYRAAPRSSIFDHPQNLGLHWVGDLAIEAEVAVASESGQLTFDLIEAGRHHECVIDLATGTATLRINQGQVPFQRDDAQGDDASSLKELSATTGIRGAGNYEIRFANVDDQLILWIDGAVVEFAQPATYGPTLDDRPQAPTATEPGDLHPLRVGATGADVTVQRLRVLRDIYYIATDSQEASPSDYQRFTEMSVRTHLMSPANWRPGDEFDKRNTVEFSMGENQFFPLGDNSPYSRDGRMWGEEHYVERDMLIGKAVMIYWPHAWRVNIPGTQRSIPVLPNFRRFGLIH